MHIMYLLKVTDHKLYARGFIGGGVLDFGLDGGVPPGPRDPNPCLE